MLEVASAASAASEEAYETSEVGSHLADSAGLHAAGSAGSHAAGSAGSLAAGSAASCRSLAADSSGSSSGQPSLRRLLALSSASSSSSGASGLAGEPASSASSATSGGPGASWAASRSSAEATRPSALAGVRGAQQESGAAGAAPRRAPRSKAPQRAKSSSSQPGDPSELIRWASRASVDRIDFAYAARLSSSPPDELSEERLPAFRAFPSRAEVDKARRAFAGSLLALEAVKALRAAEQATPVSQRVLFGSPSLDVTDPACERDEGLLEQRYPFDTRLRCPYCIGRDPVDSESWCPFHPSKRFARPASLQVVPSRSARRTLPDRHEDQEDDHGALDDKHAIEEDPEYFMPLGDFRKRLLGERARSPSPPAPVGSSGVNPIAIVSRLLSRKGSVA